jgi:hypothetical protein
MNKMIAVNDGAQLWEFSLQVEGGGGVRFVTIHLQPDRHDCEPLVLTLDSDTARWLGHALLAVGEPTFGDLSDCQLKLVVKTQEEDLPGL